MLTSFWKSYVRLGSLIPFPLYFIFHFEIKLFCQSLDGGTCVLSRDVSVFLFIVPRHVCGGCGKVSKFMLNSVVPHNKEGNYIYLPLWPSDV